jgi:hypothetical protein
MGRGVTHKVLAVRLFMERKTFTQIRRRINHSYRAIQRYIEDFHRGGDDPAGQTVFEISFLRRISPTLVREHQVLYDTYNTDTHRERLAKIMAQFRPGVQVSEAEKEGPRS